MKKCICDICMKQWQRHGVERDVRNLSILRKLEPRTVVWRFQLLLTGSESLTQSIRLKMHLFGLTKWPPTALWLHCERSCCFHGVNSTFSGELWEECGTLLLSFLDLTADWTSWTSTTPTPEEVSLTYPPTYETYCWTWDPTSQHPTLPTMVLAQ